MTVRLTFLILIATLCASTGMAQSSQYKKAAKAYAHGSYLAARDRLLKIEKPDAQCRILLAKVLYQLSDYEQIAKLLAGLELDRNARLALATSYHHNGEYEKARVIWKTLLTDEDHTIILSNIGDTYYSLGEIDSSLVYAEQAYTLEPHSDLFALNLGITYSALEESDKACAHYFLSAQRGNRQALSLYESENCVSWQRQWLEVVPGNRVEQLSNTLFPELHRVTLATHERILLSEHGQAGVVILTDIVRTDVGAVLTFVGRDQQIIRRWFDFNQKPEFSLADVVVSSAGR